MTSMKNYGHNIGVTNENMFSSYQPKNIPTERRRNSQPNCIRHVPIEVNKRNVSGVNVETCKPAGECRFTDNHKVRSASLEHPTYSHTTVNWDENEPRKCTNKERTPTEFIPIVTQEHIDNDNLSWLRRHENGHLLLKNSIYPLSFRYPAHTEQKLKHSSPLDSHFSSYFSTLSCSSHDFRDSWQEGSDIDSEVFDLCIYPSSNGYDETGKNIGCTLSSVEPFATNLNVADGDKVQLNYINTENITSRNQHVSNLVPTDQDCHYVLIDADIRSNRQLQNQISSTRTIVLTDTERSAEENCVDTTSHHLYKKHSSGGDSHGSKNKHYPATKRHPSKEKEFPGENRTEKLHKNLNESFCEKYTSCRWRLAYLCFLVRFIQTALRQCMGVAIIGMTLRKLATPGSQVFNSSDLNVTHIFPDFEWSSAFEGAILTSFNLGSIITPIIVGYLTTRHGGRKLMTLCLAVGGVFTIFLPLVANVSTVFIIIFRIFTGVALSGTDSLVQSMLARWAPLYEKASLSVCAYTGLSVAGVLTFLVCGYIVSIGGEGNGWPYIFYIFGGLCLLLAPAWYFCVYDSPETHPKITKKELAIIAFNKQSEKHDVCKQQLNIPWRRIMRSSAVWVILMGHVTHKWILSFMLSYLPRYFADLFHFDMKTDGLFSSIPFAGRIVAGLAAGYVSDLMLRKGFTTEKTRKFFQATGCWGCAVCSLLIAFVPSLSNVWSISLLVLALSCQDLTSVAFRINLLDIAPRYAGLLNGMVSTVATLTSLPAPVLTSLLISGGSRAGWSVVFCLVASLNIVGGAIFTMFAKGEVQDWAEATYVENTPRETKGDLGIFTLDSSNDPIPQRYDVVNGKVLRAVQSMPANLQRQTSNQKEKVTRRATFDVASMIKRVQNEAFVNLALADM